MKNNATVGIETIGPKEAAALLENQCEQQRPLRPTYAARLAREMIEGEWRLSPDAIVIVNGLLANGQHRLNAIIQSKTHQKFLVLRTNDESVFPIMDCGIKRKERDVLSGEGLAWSSGLAAAARLAMDIESGCFTIRGRNPRNDATRSTILDFSRENSERMIEALRHYDILYRKTKILSRGIAVGLEMSCKQPQKFREFLTSVYEDCKKGTPAYLLRERLIANLGGRTQLRRPTLLALIIKAYNAALLRKNLRSLKTVENEEFPEILDGDEAAGMAEETRRA